MRFGPAVRILVNQHGLNPALVKATGPHGTLLKSDVLAVISAGGLPKTAPVMASPQPKPVAPTPKSGVKPGATPVSSPFMDMSVSDLRRQFGSSLTAAKFTAPHAYQTVDVDLSRIDALIKSLITKKSSPQFGHFLRMAAIVKQTAAALNKVKLSTDQLNLVDLAVVFGRPDGSESMSHLTRVGGLNVSDIATFLEQGKATQDGKSSASVSFHASMPEPVVLRRFSAVVRPPQVAAVSVTQLPLAIVPGANGKPKLAPFYSVTISYDCSKVDDASAASFLNAIATSLATPGL